jgi:hypothetical protein
MIADSLNAARLALSHWPLTLCAVIVYSVFGGIFGAESMLDAGMVAGLILPVTLAMFFISYFLARQAGAPAENEKGSIGRWFGWGVLAIVPTVVLMVFYVGALGFEPWSNSQTPVWPETLLYVCGTILGLPLMAVSIGRAIRYDGLGFTTAFNYCKRNAAPLAIAGVTLLLVPNLITDFCLNSISLNGLSFTASVAMGVCGGLAMLATSVLLTGISAAAYRNAEKETKALSVV